MAKPYCRHTRFINDTSDKITTHIIKIIIINDNIIIPISALTPICCLIFTLKQKKLQKRVMILQK